MNDKEIEKIQTVDIRVTAESLDAHVLCLRENLQGAACFEGEEQFLSTF